MFATKAIGILILGLALAVEQAVAGADLFFSDTNTSEISIVIGETDQRRLQNDPRTWVTATVQLNDEPPAAVRLKLKGHSTFQSVDRRPSFSIKAVSPEATFPLRFTLENASRDPTLMAEAFAAWAFNACGVAAPRTAFAIVSLNGRRLGAYVAKEGYSDAFLVRAFGTSAGALHEGALADLVNRLEEDKSAESPQNILERFRTAITTSAVPVTIVRQFFDMPRLNRYVALENMLPHIDGYWFSRNNFRVYEHPTEVRLYFIPHSVDRIALESTRQILSPGKSLLSRVLIANPVWRQDFYGTASNLLAGPLTPEQVSSNFVRLSNAVVSLTRLYTPSELETRLTAIHAFGNRLDSRIKECQMNLRARGHWGNRSEFEQTDWFLSRAKEVSLVSDNAKIAAIRAKDNLVWTWTARSLCRPGRTRFEGKIETQSLQDHAGKLEGKIRIQCPDGTLVEGLVAPDQPFSFPIVIPDDGDDLYTWVKVEFQMTGSNVQAALSEFRLCRPNVQN